MEKSLQVVCRHNSILLHRSVSQCFGQNIVHSLPEGNGVMPDAQKLRTSFFSNVRSGMCKLSVMHVQVGGGGSFAHLTNRFAEAQKFMTGRSSAQGK